MHSGLPQDPKLTLAVHLGTEIPVYVDKQKFFLVKMQQMIKRQKNLEKSLKC